MLYFPEREFIATPQEIGLHYQDIIFSPPSGRKLHGWFIPHLQSKATFLFFHGNAGNISHRLEKIKIVHEMGAATFIIDYSGYGKSEGKPSEENLYEDGAAAYAHTIDKLQIDPKKLFFYGESLGCAVAIEQAARKDAAGLILEAPFTSLKALAKLHMPFLSGLAGEQYDNLGKIDKIKMPILFIHPRQDEICPFDHALQLFAKAAAPKTNLWLDEGGHNDAFFVNKELYFSTLCSFVSSRCF